MARALQCRSNFVDSTIALWVPSTLSMEPIASSTVSISPVVSVLPETLAIGDAISHVREQMQTEKGLGLKFTFSGSVYFERMKERGSYGTDVAAIRQRVEAAGLTGVFAPAGGSRVAPRASGRGSGGLTGRRPRQRGVAP